MPHVRVCRYCATAFPGKSWGNGHLFPLASSRCRLRSGASVPGPRICASIATRIWDSMHKPFTFALLAFAGGAMAAEAVLVHDIAPPHPRYAQLTQMAAEVAKRTQGMLTIAINPGGKVLYPGQASLD